MKMAENCDATSGVGSLSAPTPGSDSFADCSFVMNISSLPIEPSSISPASGSRCGNVYETRSSNGREIFEKKRVDKGYQESPQTGLAKHSGNWMLRMEPRTLLQRM